MAEQVGGLVDAVRKGDLAAVRGVLFSGTDIEPEALSGPAFQVALDAGFTSIASLLLADKRFDPDVADGEPLRHAIRLGYLDLAGALLEAGANPNIRGEDFSSAMLMALEYEYYELARLMIDKGAEVNIRNQRGWTPLIWAAIKGYL